MSLTNSFTVTVSIELKLSDSNGIVRYENLCLCVSELMGKTLWIDRTNLGNFKALYNAWS